MLNKIFFYGLNYFYNNILLLECYLQYMPVLIDFFNFY